MTYQDSLNYLSDLGREYMDMRLGLGPVSDLLGRLDHPQDQYPSVLIAGTNGKGSIAAMTASILSEAGLKTGLYTSPHLVDIRERITINGEMISPEAFAGCIEEVKGRKTENVTYFEFLTVVAFLYFAQKKIDVAVLEVGLGGRLDATNCVNPAVSVVSNIAFDHTEYLGKTLAEIAREKGGIIKTGGVCVTAARQKKVIEVLATICKEKEAALYRIGKEIKTTVHRDGTFSYRGIDRYYPCLTHRLPGRHQVENTAGAIAAIELMRRKGFPIGDDALMRGIENVRWPGRMEVIRREPTVILDVAHNPAGVTVLCRALKSDFSYRRLIVVFGVFRDKDYLTMVRKLAFLADEFIFTSPGTERALPPEALLDIARPFKRLAQAVQKPIDALRKALDAASVDDLICAAGSLYMIGEIKRDWALPDP
ncbi:MAG: bifunctional folylpolyglutamate synthase/dihydrofolate synthase [Deltaproteobacteria bacterium]|nr:bifunctional folylpolyglutamate synthase/dihydrofolate synthase [Deltaproteobacteria bacterium]